MSNIDSARIWEDFEAARTADEHVDPAEFARSYGESAQEVLELLLVALDLEGARPTRPLVDLEAGEDGRLCFAGFRLVRELGRGGFGIVYEAQPTEGDGATVALKILNPLLTADARTQRDLLREAAISSQLDHPGIVHVVDSGEERGYAWLATELVDGKPLDAACKDDPMGLAHQLVAAVAHAHNRGVVHRDLKPANVLVSSSGELKVLDFGLARADQTAVSVSLSGELIGTPLYMAPEQLRRGGAVGPWSDVYALGLLLLELFAPRAAARLAVPERLSKRLAGRVERVPRSILAALPAPVRQIVARCVEPHCADRYPSAVELSEDLTALRNDLPLPHGRPSAGRRLARDLMRRRERAAAAGLLAVAAVGVVYELWWMAPVAVRISTFDTAKVLVIDGREIGVSPVTARLRPGIHEWSASSGGPESGDPEYRGRFHVAPRGGVQHEFLFLDWFPHIYCLERSEQVDDTSGEFALVPAGDGAWITVALHTEEGTNEFMIRDLPGRAPVTTQGLFRTRLPNGPYRLTVEAEGYRAEELHGEIDGDRMHFHAAQLDPVGSTEHSVPLYSHLEESVRRFIVVQENLRTFMEGMAHHGSDDLYVMKPYLGLRDWGRSARLLLRVELPVAVEDLKFSGSISHGQRTEDRGSVLVSAGADPDHLVPILGHPKGTAAAQAPEHLDTTELVGLCQGSRELWLEWRLEPSFAGDDFSFVSALRSEALPRARGEDRMQDFLWEPSLTILVQGRE